MDALSPDNRQVVELIRCEHEVLREKIGQLRSVCTCAAPGSDCTGCGSGQADRCETSVARILEEVFVFMVEHFRTEEAIMRQHRLDDLDWQACEGHREAHAELAERARHLIASLNTQTVLPRLNDLVGLLEGWLEGHILAHDHMFLGLLGIEGRTIHSLVRAPA